MIFRTAGCTTGYTWSAAFANTNVIGGTANGATSVSACQTACSISANCIGIDWNLSGSTGQQCFLVYTTTSGPRQNGTAIGITHYDYVYVNCNRKDDSHLSSIAVNATNRKL